MTSDEPCAAHTPPTGPIATGLDLRTAAVLAYLAWWLTGALFLALEPTHRFVRFHARQALVVFGLIWIVGVALWMASLLSMFLSPVLFRVTAVLAPAVWLAGVALWAICLAQAARGRWWRVPVIGSWLAARDPRP
jgi:uncharacterized membrane protein